MYDAIARVARIHTREIGLRERRDAEVQLAEVVLNLLVPLGSFFSIEFVVFIGLFSHDNLTEGGLHPLLELGAEGFGIHGGVGRNYVFFDRLVLNYEVSYAYTYGFLKVMGFTKDTRPNAHYGDAIYSNLISIRLGLGFLPF